MQDKIQELDSEKVFEPDYQAGFTKSEFENTDTQVDGSKNDSEESGSDENVIEKKEGGAGNEAVTVDNFQVLEAEKARLEEAYKRLAAEFDNYKKRTQREIADLVQTANKRVVLLMLEILDDMERAEKQEIQDQEAFRQGATLIFDKMRNTLQQVGVEKLEALDTDFNTDLHEAVTEVPVDESKRGKVVDVVQPGYTLGGKLIRFAKVIIGK